jgi:hypothetical protein
VRRRAVVADARLPNAQPTSRRRDPAGAHVAVADDESMPAMIASVAVGGDERLGFLVQCVLQKLLRFVAHGAKHSSLQPAANVVHLLEWV